MSGYFCDCHSSPPEGEVCVLCLSAELEKVTAELAKAKTKERNRVADDMNGAPPFDIALIIGQTAFESLFPQWARRLARAYRDACSDWVREQTAVWWAKTWKATAKRYREHEDAVDRELTKLAAAHDELRRLAAALLDEHDKANTTTAADGTKTRWGRGWTEARAALRAHLEGQQ